MLGLSRYEMLVLDASSRGRKQFGNPEEREYPLLEAVTRGLVKTQLTEKTNCVTTRSRPEENWGWIKDPVEVGVLSDPRQEILSSCEYNVVRTSERRNDYANSEGDSMRHPGATKEKICDACTNCTKCSLLAV
jgi:hypothetical protein